MDIPDALRTAVVFDQSIFVKTALKNLLKEGGIGLALTGLMILLFLGKPARDICGAVVDPTLGADVLSGDERDGRID